MKDEPKEKSKRTHELGATRVINLAHPARGEDTGEFQGHRYEAGISFIVALMQPVAPWHYGDHPSSGEGASANARGA